MPYEPLSLASTIQSVWDAYIDNNPPEITDDGGEVEGVADTVIWEDIRSSAGDDPISPLRGMEFDTAVAVDPRRIDAMIQQRVSGPMYKVNRMVADAQDWTGHEEDRAQLQRNEAYLDRYQYLLRMHLIRQNHNGEVDAEGLAQTFQLSWQSASKILETSVKMVRPGTTAELMWNAIAQTFPDIQRNLREAQGLAERAAGSAPDGESMEAWERYVELLKNIEENYRNGLESMGQNIAQLGGEGFGSLNGPRIGARGARIATFGGVSNASWLQDRMLAGRRTTQGAQASVGQWRRSGGRYW